MAQTTITTITDDLDGSPNAEPVHFSIGNKAYRIDLSAKNRAAFDRALEKWVSAAHRDGAVARATRGPARGRKVVAKRGGKTLFSKLDVEEKDRFRKWGVRRKLTTKTARRIADSAVQAWIDAGRP